MGVRYSFEETKKIVHKNSECELIDCWYENGRKQLKLMCKCGNIFQTDWRQFNRKDITPIRARKDCREYKKTVVNRKSKYIGSIIGDYYVMDNFNEDGDTLYKVRCIHCGCIVVKGRTAIDHGVCDCQKSIRNCERNTRLGEIYHHMLQRCNCPTNVSYRDYGGRGIRVCEEWQTFQPFKEWSLANGYSDELSIDRIDVNGDYSPDNCRWATNYQQANNKRNSHMITYNNETKTIKEWSDEFGLKQNTLLYRIRRGWDIETALLTPVKNYKEGDTHEPNN